MKESPKDHLDRLTRNLISKIARQKKKLYGRELTNTYSDPECRLISQNEIEAGLQYYAYIHRATISGEKEELVNDLLERLSEHQVLFDIVTMYYYNGETMEQIAEVYSKSKAWVGKRLQDAYVIMRGEK